MQYTDVNSDNDISFLYFMMLKQRFKRVLTDVLQNCHNNEHVSLRAVAVSFGHKA